MVNEWVTPWATFFFPSPTKFERVVLDGRPLFFYVHTWSDAVNACLLTMLTNMYSVDDRGKRHCSTLIVCSATTVTQM